MQLKKYETVIVLVNYNSFDDTKACIESVFQYNNGNVFIIIVDNNSTEKRSLTEITGNNQDVFLLENQENVGFGRANNQGINYALNSLEFKYLFLLNNDTLIVEDTITNLVKGFDLNDKIGVTTSKILYEDNRESVWFGGGEINFKRGRPIISDFNNVASNTGANKSKYITFASGCAMFFKKNIIEQFKGFDDDFFMYYEDFELCLRLNNKKVLIYYVAESIIYHKVQGSIKKEGDKVTGIKYNNPNLEFLFYNMKSNQYLSMRKNTKGFSWIKFKFYYWLEFLFIVSKILLKGNKKVLKIAMKTIKRINTL